MFRFVYSPSFSVILFSLLLLTGAPAWGEANWTAYVGNQTKTAPWAGFLRGVALGRSGTALRSAEAGAAVDNAKLSELASHLAQYARDGDVIAPVGGLGSGRQQQRVNQFLDFISGDNAAAWKQIVEQQTRAVANATKNGQGKVYWQIGNEINSRHFSATFRTWAGAEVPGQSRKQERPARRMENGARAQSGRDSAKEERPPSRRRGDDKDDNGDTRTRAEGGARNDDFVIPIYVEYFLAPTVEGIRKASRELRAPVPIVLGTLANSRAESSRDWLKRLLEYRIEGRFASTLKGRQVYELVDILAIHYLVSYPGDDWRATLDELHAEWVGRGGIRGIWSTEELGRRRALRGIGAATSFKVVARYLDWALDRQATPEQVRVNLWGGNLGQRNTQADYGLSMLEQFLGQTALTPINHEAFGVSDNNIELYGFNSADTGKTVIIVFGRERNTKATLGQLSLGGVPPRKGDVQVHIFSKHGRSTAGRPVRSENGGRLQFKTPLNLDDETTVVIELSG